MSGLDTVCPKQSYLDSELANGVGVTPTLLTALSAGGLVALKAGSPTLLTALSAGGLVALKAGSLTLLIPFPPTMTPLIHVTFSPVLSATNHTGPSAPLSRLAVVSVAPHD